MYFMLVQQAEKEYNKTRDRNIVGIIRYGDELTVNPRQATRVMKVFDLMFGAEREGSGQKCEI